jgi:hypothetical protein
MKVVFRDKRIRIRWNVERGVRISRWFLKNRKHNEVSSRNLALAASSLLAPCALVAFTITCWSMAASLRWTSGFFLSRGFFSHWQSWFVASLVLFLLSRLLAQCVDETDSEYRQ